MPEAATTPQGAPTMELDEIVRQFDRGLLTVDEVVEEVKMWGAELKKELDARWERRQWEQDASWACALGFITVEEYQALVHNCGKGDWCPEYGVLFAQSDGQARRHSVYVKGLLDLLT